MNERTDFSKELEFVVSVMVELRDRIEELLKERADSAVAELMNQMITALFQVEAKLNQWAKTQLELVPVQERLVALESQQSKLFFAADAIRQDLSELVATLTSPLPQD